MVWTEPQNNSATFRQAPSGKFLLHYRAPAVAVFGTAVLDILQHIAKLVAPGSDLFAIFNKLVGVKVIDRLNGSDDRSCAAGTRLLKTGKFREGYGALLHLKPDFFGKGAQTQVRDGRED